MHVPAELFFDWEAKDDPDAWRAFLDEIERRAENFQPQESHNGMSTLTLGAFDDSLR